MSTRRIFDPDRVAVDFFDTDISQFSGSREFSVNRLGVSTLRTGQFLPTVARIVLDVDRTSSDWESRYDAARGGVLLYPAGGERSATLEASAPSDYDGPLATLQSVQLIGNQIVISADGFLFYRSGWDPDSRAYRISVSPARLPEALPDPGLGTNSPVERIRFAQENDTTVSILISPSRNVDIFEPDPGQGSRRITLQLLGEGEQPGTPPLLTTTPPPPLELLPPLTSPNIPAPPSLPSLPSNPSPPSNNRPNPTGITIALDAGHGGNDPGALAVNGMREKEVNLDITRRVQQLLSQRGYNIVMTRVDDREILLQPRVDTAVAGGASILVSIHTNALNRNNVSGIETYYLRPDSARLAQVLHNNIIAGSGAINRNVRQARFFMVRETPTTMPSVLLELGYLTHPGEAARLATSAYRQQLAESIARGIDAYFGR